VDTIQATASRLTPELFERLREKREKSFLEFLVSQPYRHAVNKLDLLVDRPKWDVRKRLECVKEVGLEDLVAFAKRALSRFRLKGLVHGNVSPEEAKHLTKIVLDGFQPKPPLFLTEFRVSQIEVGDTVYRMAGYNKDETVSCAVSLYQMGSMNLEVNAALSVLNHLFSEPAYSILRTEEQLGYIVFSQIKTCGAHIKHFMLLVQGDAYDPIHMCDRMEVFVQAFRQTIVEMPDEEFATNIEAVVQALTQKNKNLSEESHAHWRYISDETYDFRRLKAIAGLVKNVSKDDVVGLYDRFLLAGSVERRKLSVQVFGSEHATKMEDPVADGVRLVADADEYVRRAPLHPTSARGRHTTMSSAGNVLRLLTLFIVCVLGNGLPCARHASRQMTRRPSLSLSSATSTAAVSADWIVYVDHSKPSLEKGAAATLDAFLSLTSPVNEKDRVHVRTAFLPRGAKTGQPPWVRCVDVAQSEALEVFGVDSVDKVYRVLTKHMGLRVSHWQAYISNLLVSYPTLFSLPSAR
jgi:hypothetical protein